MPRLKKRADGRYMLQRTYDGKTVSFYGKSENEVRRKLAEYEERMKAPATYREISEAWYDDAWDSFAPGTQNSYRQSYRRALDSFGDKLAAEVTPQDVSVLLKQLIKQKYSSKTVKTQKTVISTIYRHAIENGIRVQNPASEVRVPRGLPKTHRLPPSDEDIRRVIETDDEWLFPRLLLYTGLRRGEALALTYEDIDRKQKTITVNKEIIFKSNTPILVEHTKTNAGIRKVLLPDALAELLPEDGTGRIFELTYRTFKTNWDHYCKRVGVSFTPHQLRHAYASFLLDAEVPVKDAQRLLGHADVATTQNVYTHILESRQSHINNAINDYFNQRMKKDVTNE